MRADCNRVRETGLLHWTGFHALHLCKHRFCFLACSIQVDVGRRFSDCHPAPLFLLPYESRTFGDFDRFSIWSSACRTHFLACCISISVTSASNESRHLLRRSSFVTPPSISHASASNIVMFSGVKCVPN